MRCCYCTKPTKRMERDEKGMSWFICEECAARVAALKDKKERQGDDQSKVSTKIAEAYPVLSNLPEDL